MSIVMRIYFGMGALITLFIIVGAFASFQTSGLAQAFGQYRDTAKTELVVSEMTSDIYEARLSSTKFRATKDKTALDKVGEKVDHLIELLPVLEENVPVYEGVEDLSLLPDLLSSYYASLLKAADLQDIRDDLVVVTAQVGRSARTRLSEVIETAMRDEDTVASAYAGLATSNVLLARLYLERFLVTNAATDAERSAKELQLARVGISNLLQQLEDPRRIELAQDALSDLKVFAESKEQLDSVIGERNSLYQSLDEIGPKALGVLTSAVAAAVEQQNSLGPAVLNKARNSILVVSLIVAAGAFFGLLLAVMTGRLISNRLSRVTADMSELSRGNLEIDLEPTEEKHEIALMTNAMVVFRDNAVKARALDEEIKAAQEREAASTAEQRKREMAQEEERRAADEKERQAQLAQIKTVEDFQTKMEHVLGEAASGNFSNRMPSETNDENLTALAAVVNRLLEVTEANISDVVESIGDLAQGNLGTRIEGERQGSFLRMQEDFNAALGTLSESMGQVKQSGLEVSATSSELETSSLNMAKRAEDNAAAVQETSSAIEQITASIKKVVANARAADEATRRVRESADKTREVSTNTEASINAMTEASAQINRVVKVIEDIAFQINLLALNAGVEAARAGEAGRGFSVVASEVRALAQRSQEAVQEISEVITQNNESVQAGVEQVGLSRKALEEIISEVEVASAQISDIASAVEQQSVGIEEVNSAVRSIDSTAQTNAATLEEMTASSVSLSKEAVTLGQALNLFSGVSETVRAAAIHKPDAVAKVQSTQVTAPQKVAAAGGSPSTIHEGWDEF